MHWKCFFTHLHLASPLVVFLRRAAGVELEATLGFCRPLLLLLHCLGGDFLDKPNHCYVNQLRRQMAVRKGRPFRFDQTVMAPLRDLITWFFPVSHLGFPSPDGGVGALPPPVCRVCRKTYRKHLTTGSTPDFSRMVLQIKETGRSKSVQHLNLVDLNQQKTSTKKESYLPKVVGDLKRITMTKNHG